MIGNHVVTVAGLDLSCLVDDVAIVHGRGTTTAQPAASTATISLDLADTELPADVEIGAEVVVTTEPVPGIVLARFRGRVTDLTLGWDDAGEDTPNAGIGQLVAAGPLADLGRRVIGDEPWPAELDGARVARALALAGVILDPVTSDPGTVTVLPRDVDATDALGIVDETAATAAGIVWETAAGEIRYADAEHRRGTLPAITLDACDLLVSPAWARTLDGMTNRVSIGYGVGEDGGEQPRVAAENAKSIERYGILDYSASTTLADKVDADELAALLVARNSYPVWIMAALPVDVKRLTEIETVDLLALDVNALIYLSAFPAIAETAPTSAYLWVEGWTERLAWDAHDLALTVSGYCRTSPPPRWDDVDPSWEWDAVDLTWDDLTCLPPVVPTDRWTDVPASNRWDLTPPEITWDTWDPTATKLGV